MDWPNQERPDKRQQIRRRQHFAFLFPGWPVLKQGRNWNDKEPSCESQQRKLNECAFERGMRNGQRHAYNGHAKSSQWDETVLNFAAREITSRNTPEPDAKGQRNTEQTDL